MTYERPREKQWLIHPAVDHAEGNELPSPLDSRDRMGKEQMSVIGADITITGNIEASVDLHIEGRVSGDVRCSTLILGEQSNVVGKIFADRVRVSGLVDGAIDTRDLAVEATARVTGDILYERLRVSNGGVIEGHLKQKPIGDRPIEVTELKVPKTLSHPPIEKIEKKIEKKAEPAPEVKIFE